MGEMAREVVRLACWACEKHGHDWRARRFENLLDQELPILENLMHRIAPVHDSVACAVIELEKGNT